MDGNVERALTDARVIARREHPALGSLMSRLCQRGELVSVLPGVYALPHLAGDWRTRASAACLYDPTAVISGDAAAALTYWPELVPDEVEVAGRRKRVSRPGFRFVQRPVPPDLVMRRRRLRLTVPALTALDQVAEHGGEGIDRALRRRRATLAGMRNALHRTPMRRGNRDRRQLLLDSRDAPWSEAERLAHRLLREAGITGWSTNVRINCRGTEYFLDIAFRDSPLVIEIDGREFHGSEKFEEDRHRGNDLLLAGKRVLHFTWLMLNREPELVVGTTLRARQLIG